MDEGDKSFLRKVVSLRLQSGDGGDDQLSGVLRRQRGGVRAGMLTVRPLGQRSHQLPLCAVELHPVVFVLGIVGVRQSSTMVRDHGKRQVMMVVQDQEAMTCIIILVLFITSAVSVSIKD